MIDQYPSPNGVLTSLIWRKTAVGGETSLSGYDNASQALSYTPGQEQVYLNGILLVRGDDYTATNGTSITGLTALTASDFVQVNCYNNFSVASVPAASITGEITSSQVASTIVTTTGTQTLTNKTVNLTSNTLSGTTAQFNTALSDGDFATLAGSETLTNKTLTSPTITSASGVINNTLTTTTGDIIYASSANTPARLGIGSSGNVLTVSGGVPSWAAPASSGGMTLINTGGTTLTGASVTISSIPGTYKDLILYVYNPRPATDAIGNGQIRFNSDSTSNYTYTGDKQIYRVSWNATSAAIGPEGTSSTNNGLHAITIPQYANTSTFKIYFGKGSSTSYSTGNITMENFMGAWGGTSAITSITILPYSGNWTSGTAYLYGVS